MKVKWQLILGLVMLMGIVLSVLTSQAQTTITLTPKEGEAQGIPVVRLSELSIGTLAQVVGRVVSRGTDHFYLDDGSQLQDSTGAVGLRVTLKGLAQGNVIPLPAMGATLRVTGILSRERDTQGRFYTVLRPRRASDITASPMQRQYASPTFPRDRWYEFSLPAEPVNPAPAALFNQFPLDNRLNRWSRVMQRWGVYNAQNESAFGGLLALEGYRLRSDAPRMVLMTGYAPDPGADRLVRFPRPGAHLFGSSLPDPVLWNRCLISDGIEMLTIAQAAQRGWIDPVLRYLNGTVYWTIAPDDTGDDDSLRPWRAYWITTYRPNLQLIIPLQN